jgi:uncharacterized protein (TIGR02246 family)
MRLIIFTAMFMVAAQIHTAEAASVGDEAAVRAVVLKYTQARTLEDSKAVAALFTVDSDQHTSAGEWRRGRDQVVAGTQRSSANNPGARRIDIETVRFIADDVAMVDGPYVVGDGANARTYWTMLLLKRQADGWRISAIRNMAPTGR